MWWLLAFIISAVLTVATLTHRPADRLVDLSVYVGAAHAIVHGHSVYSFHSLRGAPFTYPPVSGIFFVPLAFIPLFLLQLVWTLATIVVVGAISIIAIREIRRYRSTPTWLLALAFTIILVSKPVLSNLRFGQVSIGLGLMVLVDVLVLEKKPQQGLLTGLAAAIKLTPLIFILYFVCTGRRKSAWLAITSFAVCTGIGWLVLPHDSWVFWTKDAWTPSRIPVLAEGGNQSINGILLRAGASGHLRIALWIIASLVIAIVGLWRARKADLAGQPLLAACIVGCVGLLTSPVSWTHHGIWLVLAAGGIFVGCRQVNGPGQVNVGRGQVNRTERMNWVLRAGILLIVIVGLAPLAHLGVGGKWIAVNCRALLSFAIACVLPIATVSGSVAAPEALKHWRSGLGLPL